MVLFCINLVLFLTIVISVLGDDVSDHKGWNTLRQTPTNITCGRIQPPLNGSKNSKGEFPWMAKLIRKGARYDNLDYLVYHCAGSLISNQFVVTSASCLKNMNLHHIKLGTSDLSENLRNGVLSSSYKRNPVTDYFPAEEISIGDYFKSPPMNDFGWIKLNSTVTFTDDIYPICLPREDKAGTTLTFTMAGWSWSGDTQKNSVLRKQNVNGLSTEDCKSKHFSALLDDNNLCVDGFTECDQEGGGPLMRIDEFEGQKYYFLYGVARKQDDEPCNSLRLFTNAYKFVINILNTVDLKYGTCKECEDVLAYWIQFYRLLAPQRVG